MHQAKLMILKDCSCLQMVMVCYGLINPPEPPYILIAMASIQGIAFNVLWVGADDHLLGWT